MLITHYVGCLTHLFKVLLLNGVLPGRERHPQPVLTRPRFSAKCSVLPNGLETKGCAGMDVSNGGQGGQVMSRESSGNDTKVQERPHRKRLSKIWWLGILVLPLIIFAGMRWIMSFSMDAIVVVEAVVLVGWAIAAEFASRATK